MIVNELDVLGTFGGPTKAQSKLVVHPDRMLPLPDTLQRLKAIGGWDAEIGEIGRRETLMFNGYADEVAYLYDGMDLSVYY
mgnify:CR=1 FL=1